jgi:farnesyl-diphosphate farnesyltransferase
MLFLVGATLVLSHEETRSQLENVIKDLVPIAADHLLLMLSSIVFCAFVTFVYKKFFSNKKVAKGEEQKQGAYGKVIMHEHSLWTQLSYPGEILAGIRLVLEKKFNKSKGIHTKLSKELWDHLNKTSRSFAAVIRILPSPDVSDSVCIFYLLLRALDTIEDEMDLTKFEEFRKEGETALQAKVRLLCTFHTLLDDGPNDFPLEQVLNSQIGAAAEKALLNSVPLLIEGFHQIKEGLVVKNIVLLMGQGMSEYVIRDMQLGTRDDADYDRYCHIVAGLVGKGLTEIFCNLGYEDVALIDEFELWNSMGLLLQRTNITRDVCEDAAEGRSWWPQTIWQSGEIPAASLKDLKDLAILNKMVANALNLVPIANHYLNRLKHPAIFGFCAVPQIMAIATLEACYANPNVYTGVVKIRSGKAASLVLSLRKDTVTAAQLSYKVEATSLINSIRNKAITIGDTETIAACDKALEGFGARIPKKLVSTSNTQIAFSYTAFLGAVWAMKSQQAPLQSLFAYVDSVVEGDAGLALAFTMSLGAGCILTAASVILGMTSRA